MVARPSRRLRPRSGRQNAAPSAIPASQSASVPATTAPYPSGELVLGVVEREYDRSVEHFRALDVKAATLITFAGALIALGKDLASPWKALCVLFAALSGLSALACYWPRSRSAIAPSGVENYMAAQPGHTTYYVTRTLVQLHGENEKSANAKRLWLRVSLGLLAVTALMYGTGIVNPHFEKDGNTHVRQQPGPTVGHSGPGVPGSPDPTTTIGAGNRSGSPNTVVSGGAGAARVHP